MMQSPPNEQHLSVLKQGVEAWNRWCKEIREADCRFGAELSGADLNGAVLRGIDLRNANLDGIKLREADLREADLRGSDLRDADLCGAYLIDADLTSANLIRANLFGAKLDGADLSCACFNEANLSDALLIGVQLRNGHLSNANLDYTNLSDSSLIGATLYFTKLRRTKLDGVDFEDARFSYSVFVDCDLSEVKGLNSVKHDGPSSIGLDTIYRSAGTIPQDFLRGCGVPEGFITQMYSLVDAEDGIQFYSCFISYSSKDESFARRLHGKMRDAHLRVWFAPEDIQGGKKLHEQIETAIRVYDKLLIVLSEASLQSEWVMDELRKGFKAERDSGKRKLFPVRLTDYKTLQSWVCRDSISGKDLAEEVRQYFISDFSNWKDHDQFEAAFARLLKDLQAEERAK